MRFFAQSMILLAIAASFTSLLDSSSCKEELSSHCLRSRAAPIFFCCASTVCPTIRGTSVLKPESWLAYCLYHRQHLRRVHLLVQELHDAAELVWNPVGHGDESHLACLEVRLDLLPDLVRF